MLPKGPKGRAALRDCKSRVRITVADAAEIEAKYAASLGDGGMFVRHDNPPPLGTRVLVELVDEAGQTLMRLAGEVVHARPAITPGERGAGMGLCFVELDEAAAALADKSRSAAPAAPSAPTARSVESVGGPERAPLITPEGPVVGIDLGTVNSCIAVVRNGRPEVLTSHLGYHIIPSVVFVPQSGEPLVGNKAVEKMILSPDRAVYGSKRFIGRPFASKEVRTLGHFFTYELVEGSDGRVAARVDETVMTLEQVASRILRALKDMAEEELGAPVQRAVITVPADFGETQRQAVRDAARMAGLYVERILNEPTAAAVSYGWGRRGDALGTILVYDLGGGTFDVAVLRIDNDRVVVLATDGDPFLGGSDFDDRLTEYVLMRFERQHGVSLRADKVAVARLRFACEIAKRQLSEAQSAEVYLPFVCKQGDGFIDLKHKLDRETLETLTHDLVDRTSTLMQRVLDAAHLTSAQLDDVLLVGGQTRSPHVRRLLGERFGRAPSQGVHPEEAVALGAAIVADALARKRPLSLVDVLPASLRIARPDGRTERLLARGARLPASASLALAPEPGNPAEYRVTIYRGEREVAVENTLVGTVRLPVGQALAFGGQTAAAELVVNAEGLLSVSIRHPVSGQVQQMAVSLVSQL